jgi:hypothetical protein
MLGAQAFGQETPERFWIAGRYDGNRIVVIADRYDLMLGNGGYESDDDSFIGALSTLEQPNAFLSTYCDGRWIPACRDALSARRQWRDHARERC